MSKELDIYKNLFADVKKRIQKAQVKAAQSANKELIRLYWDIGQMLDVRQKKEGWGAGVIPRLAVDLKNELPEIKGFSERNLKRMLRFYREYSTGEEKVPQAVAQIPWGHNILLLERVKDIQERLWYAEKTLTEAWSRNILLEMLKGNAYERQGKAITNFKSRLPKLQSGLAEDMVKDPYIFDFLTIAEPFRERELELGLLKHLEKFMLELGKGFAFVGRQYKLEVGEGDYYIDLLFYNLNLRAFFVIELKKGEFKPEYAGKMNFYCSVVDDVLRHETDNPTIGLILCQTKDSIAAEYALRDVQKPISISGYELELTRALPESLKSSLPTIEEIEEELSDKS